MVSGIPSSYPTYGMYSRYHPDLLLYDIQDLLIALRTHLNILQIALDHLRRLHGSPARMQVVEITNYRAVPLRVENVLTFFKIDFRLKREILKHWKRGELL